MMQRQITEREVDKICGNCDGRSTGGSSGNSIGGAWISWRAVMRVLPIYAVGHLIHDGLADARSTGGERSEDDRGGGSSRCVRPRPIRVAEPSDMATHVKAEDINCYDMIRLGDSQSQTLITCVHRCMCLEP